MPRFLLKIATSTAARPTTPSLPPLRGDDGSVDGDGDDHGDDYAVSYTHLTLPTTPYV